VIVLEWHRVVFFHFALEPDVVQAALPLAFELELFDAKAVVSLVALTKRRFRPAASAPWWARLVPLIKEQRLFNVRTYVRHRGEPGAFFFWSWLSRPWGIALPARPLGLTCDFAESCYEHEHERGDLRGFVKKTEHARFAYQARMNPRDTFAPCPPGSLAEFALERYMGFFWHRGAGRVFRTWHQPWLQTTLNTQIDDNGLVVNAFPWLANARFVEAQYSPGVSDVRLSLPRSVLPDGVL